MNRDIIDIFVTINAFTDNWHNEIETDNLLSFRNQIIEKAYKIKNDLYKKYGEQTSFFITFSIISYCDEKINELAKLTPSDLSNWHSLQSEMFDRNDGGDYVFEIIDKVLENPVFPGIVTKTLYLILELGFSGCHLGSQTELDKYKHQLQAILPSEPIKLEENTLSILKDNPELKQTRRSYKRHALKFTLIIAVGFAIVSYLGIYIFT